MKKTLKRAGIAEFATSLYLFEIERGPGGDVGRSIGAVSKFEPDMDFIVDDVVYSVLEVVPSFRYLNDKDPFDGDGMQHDRKSALERIYANPSDRLDRFVRGSETADAYARQELAAKARARPGGFSYTITIEADEADAKEFSVRKSELLDMCDEVGMTTDEVTHLALATLYQKLAGLRRSGCEFTPAQLLDCLGRGDAYALNDLRDELKKKIEAERR